MKKSGIDQDEMRALAQKLSPEDDDPNYSTATHCFWCGRRFESESPVTEVVEGRLYKYHAQCFEERRHEDIDSPIEVRLGPNH
jgi:hypothetical protein